MKMVEVKLLGVALQADLLNPKVVQKFETKFDETVKRIKAASSEMTGSIAIKEQCSAIIDYVDDIFGEGSAEKVFGSEVDFLTCLEALDEMASLYPEQVAPIIKKRTAKINQKLKVIGE
ncbi:hypothetical protein NE683_12350 [Bariatricus massiliensis]|uniref:DUF6673 domain-containing protein n=1 Tax=Bariatricus massiliensis TaxID=1745713 RepID=A0ABS8DH19_9FIRM|nr:DUF6673 family protein [Bariatricus massiliensis]MCB7306187.1 hypothetical protein [Bariatricus massiliensis]MCB7375265.1 hypothetical protein [Bariatricus massiliensis]MCB7387725.1 hypothetical protein [Bariatricus massiliensis]MCB7411886.1 hypothetical protein [Bariatricus massiliensis]MCQ5254022.1 hypothetical protein [Bariatricus massiliensis]